MSSKANHIGRLPVGTRIIVELREGETGDDGYPVREWAGTLEANWQLECVEVEASSKGLMGLISKLAEKWSKACPNSRMRRKQTPDPSSART